MQRVASRASSASSAASTSCISAGDTAFTGGRFSVSVETPPACSRRTVSYAMREPYNKVSTTRNGGRHGVSEAREHPAAVLHKRVRVRTPPYSHVVAVEGRRMVFISGQLARDRDGNVVDVMTCGRSSGRSAKTSRPLAAAGATLGDLVKTNDLRDRHRRVLQDVDVRMEYSAPPATSTTVEVRKLAHADFLVEVEASHDGVGIAQRSRHSPAVGRVRRDPTARLRPRRTRSGRNPEPPHRVRTRANRVVRKNEIGSSRL